MERMESLTDTGLCLQDLVSGVATSSSATSGSSESSAAHNHHQHTNHHHHHATGHETGLPAVSAVSVSSAAAGIMSGSAVLGLNHHHHVSPAIPDSAGHHHVHCAPTVLHHEPLEKLKRGEYSCNSSVRFLESMSGTSSWNCREFRITCRPASLSLVITVSLKVVLVLYFISLERIYFGSFIDADLCLELIYNEKCGEDSG
jgi:hypothetical protein